MRHIDYILASGGMKDWTLKEWAGFFAILSGFLTVTVGPFIVKTIADIRALRTQNAGQQAQINDVKVIAQANTDNIVAVATAKSQEPPPPRIQT